MLRVHACGPVRSISGLVAEYIVAIDVTRVRFPADAGGSLPGLLQELNPGLLAP